MLGGYVPNEIPDTPISLAGIRVSSAHEAKEQRKFLSAISRGVGRYPLVLASMM